MSTQVLATVSWAAESLSREPSQLLNIMRVLLGDLRRLVGMEAAELYLADPHQTCLMLSGYSGKDREAFFRKNVFEWGSGFPGIAAATRAPVVTTTLGSDRRYLRPEVPALGYQVFISQPLTLPHAVVGVVNLAARSIDRVEEAKASLATISPLLASSLYTVMTALGEETLHHVRRSDDSQDRILAMLEDGLAATSALRATLQPSNGSVVETHPGQMASCGCEPAECPAQRGAIQVSGHPMLGCRHDKSTGLRLCLPLWDEDQVRAVQTVEFSCRTDVDTEAAAPLMWISRLSVGDLGLPDTPTEHEAVEPWLEIEAFGAFRVRRDGQVLSPKDFKRRQAYRLLKILVSRWGRPVSVEELCESLWHEDAGNHRVLSRLHVTLNALRQVVEPGGPRSEPEVIVRDGNSYRLSIDRSFNLDIRRFERQIARADTQTGLEAAASYQRALRLYRGDFMEDEPFDDLFLTTRNYLRELAIRSLFRTAQIQMGHDMVPDAQTSYLRILTIDRNRYDAYEKLIAFLIERGKTSDAQAAWDRYTAAYGGEPPGITRPG